MIITAIEGNKLKLDGGAMFGNAPKELWKRWFAADDKNRILLSARSLLIQTSEGKNILFDAGIGLCFEPKLKERYGIEGNEHLLLKNLFEIGLQENDIDAVILSHLHFDHAGGLLSPYGEGKQRLLFPQATYFLSKEHWNYSKNPHVRERASFIPILRELLENSGRLLLIEEAQTPELPKELSFFSSDGHTIGLLVMTVELPDERVVCPTDVIPGMAWMTPPITMGYDRYPELIVNEKLRLFETLKERKSRIFLTHDPEVEFFDFSQNIS
jgi:glyoxylase-like metal-dependent hydrolase (beta-lactamase superfamily II)